MNGLLFAPVVELDVAHNELKIVPSASGRVL